MKRDLPALASTTFDLLIIGGGIFGACAARDAAQRGLSVALVDRGDFGGATSSQHLKMVHGGIRYLQHGDLPRLRESSQERRAWLTTAPHLVQPLPVVVPTYGYGLRGRPFLRTGMRIYDLLAFDRSRGIRDPARRVPSTTKLDRDDVLREFPGLPADGLTGAGVFFDGQIYHPPRLVLAAITSAIESGAVAANYVEVTDFIRRGDRIEVVRARDVLGGESLEIHARVILNAAGPYSERLLQRALGVSLAPPGVYSRDACFVVPRPVLRGPHALAVQGATRDPDARISRGARHLFLAPWRGHTLVGVWHVVHTRDPDAFTVTAEELARFIAEVNGACPSFGLSLDDVAQWNAGLVPFGENDPNAVHLRYGHRSRLVDHRDDGIDNLVTLIGVRFTTGRIEAARAVDLVFGKLGLNPPPCRTAVTPVAGGETGPIDAFVSSVRRETGGRYSDTVVEQLARNLGTRWNRVLRQAGQEPALADCIAGTPVLQAAVVHAVREEMAQTLADVAFRRTHLASGAYPGRFALQQAAGLMAPLLGWEAARIQREVDAVVARFPSWTVQKVDTRMTAAAG